MGVVLSVLKVWHPEPLGRLGITPKLPFNLQEIKLIALAFLRKQILAKTPQPHPG
jgi:hypothetical protein